MNNVRLAEIRAHWSTPTIDDSVSIEPDVEYLLAEVAALQTDAALGKAVREMPKGSSLCHTLFNTPTWGYIPPWCFLRYDSQIEKLGHPSYATPDEALAKAAKP